MKYHNNIEILAVPGTARLLALTLLLSAGSIRAAEVPDIVPDASSAINSTMPPGAATLSPKENKGAELAKKWINKPINPMMDADGKLVYPYGASLPTVICAPLQLCDIELQPAEKLSDVHVGDRIRWIITPATSGIAPDKIVHLNVKPTEVGINSLLIVNTDRRTYHIKLVSRNKDFMPRVGFYYQSDVDRKWAEFYEKEAVKNERNTIPETSQNVESLYFDYEIEGTAPWKPLRVYHDGKKTFVQMPKTMAQTEAPALLLVGKNGSTQIVNYRLRRDRFIVDSIFAEAILISGVGNFQKKITITRRDSESFKKKTEVRDDI